MILTGATAIVTGGAVRIGREIGRTLAEQGVNVCLHYRHSQDEAEAAVKEFASLGVQASAVQADLEDCIEAAATVVADAAILAAGTEVGKPSILINSAAIFEPGSLLETSEQQWDRHQQINLKAPFFLSQAFARVLNGSRGQIINLVDWRAARPVPGHAAYTVSKAGLIALTQLLAQELGPAARVNAIAPGAILPAPGETEKAFRKKAKLNPLNTVGSPQSIAQAVLYLLQSDFVTGETLYVTGGQQLGART